jgi:hypothetical protein
LAGGGSFSVDFRRKARTPASLADSKRMAITVNAHRSLVELNDRMASIERRIENDLDTLK